MKRQGSRACVLIAGLVFACLPAVALGQPASDDRTERKLATITASGSNVRWTLAAADSAATLTVAAPDGRVFRREFKRGASPEFTIVDRERNALPDGQYTYELRLTPVVTAAARKALLAARGRDTDAEAVRAARKPAVPAQPVVESGSFAIVKGAVVVAGEVEPGLKRPGGAGFQQAQWSDATTDVVRALYQPSRSPAALRTAAVVRDTVIPDDLIVQGSTCTGFDCVNGESFGFDTLRLKENNLQIHFDDTSSSPGFPTENWRIQANDSASGGASFLGFIDLGPSGASNTQVLRVDAGAPANAFKVSSTGKVGLRTATPVLDVHIMTSDTPAHRLEQTSSGGFSAQTWDIAGNEANFFVRDVTGGSRLPFRIRPGAPTSSLDISANGNVGIGTAGPASPIHVNAGTIGNNYTARFIDSNSAIGASVVIGSTVLAANAKNKAVFVDSTGLNFGSLPDALNAAPTTQMVIATSGNVGIGTTLPTDLLSVNGSASKPGGGSWATFSDRRLKTVKGIFNPGLSAVMQLQPLRYEYRRDNALKLPSDSEHVGFEAQAVQKIIPEAVTRNGNGYLQIDNDPILWTMLNAIKEQQAQIQQLQEEVRQLRAASRRDNK
jgi:hypothetical protein